MGEIDTKPIESVQVALSLFGEKHRPSSSDSDVEKEKDIESLQKDVASYKLQLEAKDAAYMQAILKAETYQKTAEELAVLLKKSEVERGKYIEECNEVRSRIDELESKMKDTVDQLSENAKIRGQLSHVLNELKITQAELLDKETELAASRDLELKAMTRAELMEAAAEMEKQKSEELLKQISELNDTIHMSKLAAIEAEKEKSAILYEKDSEIELITATAARAQSQLRNLRKQMEMTEELEHQVVEKSICVDSLEAKLMQANEALGSMQKAASDARNEFNNQKEDLETKTRKISDQAFCIEALEMELNRLKLELKSSNEETVRLNCNIQKLTDDLQKVNTEMDEIKNKESDAQIEIALLKAELHKRRSKIAAAEAAEARVQSIKSGVYHAVQQLAVEAEEAKKKNQRLKQGLEGEESEIPFLEQQVEKSSQGLEAEDEKHENIACVAISMEEYQSFVRKAEKADQNSKPEEEYSKQIIVRPDNHNYELETLKKELEAAMVKIGEFRTRAEQAATRAESAEAAKAAMEDRLRKLKEQKQRRKAALAALREESVPKKNNSLAYEKLPTTYQPLGKVLNMKF